MAVSAKTVISFGLVAIPIAMYTATQDNDISFNQLHEADGSRIKYKKVCAHCGKGVGAGDIVKGYQYDKDHYVIVTDDEYRGILRQLIEDKIAGKEVVAAVQEGGGNVIDLMEALQASIAQAAPEPEKPKRTRKNPKGA